MTSIDQAPFSFKIDQAKAELLASIERLELPKHPNELYEPIRYLLSLGGKRMRPLLTLMGYSLYQDDYQKAMPLALSVEVFHNFTLMHDDIMDEAPIRRGKPTVHTKWNENVAILSGDVMLVKAYDLLLELEPALLPKLIRLFNQSAAGVCEGQQLDMNFEDRETVSSAEYLEMIRLKTAVLLGFSLEAGALCAHASAADAEQLRLFGEEIGIGFQLMDDWLDVFGDPEKVGKQVGGDILSNKKTMLLITALERASPEQLAELQHWLQNDSPNPAQKVAAVTKLYEATQTKKITHQLMEEYFNQGLQRLEALPVAEARKKPIREICLSLMKEIAK